MTVALTRKQKEALDFIKSYIAANGIAPTFGEIAAKFGFRSKSGVARIVDGLAERGAITRTKNRMRSIMLVDPAEQNPFFTAQLRDYCRRSGKLPVEIIEIALIEYFAVHPFPGEPI